jgi:hypothetical protein
MGAPRLSDQSDFILGVETSSRSKFKSMSSPDSSQLQFHYREETYRGQFEEHLKHQLLADGLVMGGRVRSCHAASPISSF